ncbi:MAG: VWA domain-containing protein [Planctomyces sp.]|nr:VWA domain-containing protein [Planctomyces sp.]
MSFGFVQQMMLLGLAAVALPVIAHLLSKRKFDVIFWGAMQFLELGRRTRRRIRLEELLLLLLRIGVIAALVFAFARPWGKGGPFRALSQSVRRDVAFVIDSSYSMGWAADGSTPHAAARQWVHQALQHLEPGDTVTLIDARDSVQTLIDQPTTDLRLVREALDRLASPSGSSQLAPAASRAVQLLSRGANPIREVMILTDGQAFPWSAGDAALWARFDDLVSQQTLKPRVWAINLSAAREDSVNRSIDRLELSRPTTVAEFPVRIRTTVRQSGGASERVAVWLSVNGQRLNDQTTVVTLPAGGEAPVEFEHRFPAVGSYLATVSIEPDALPGDNDAHAVVVVAPPAPVLLVDGRPRLDASRGAAYFARAALTAAGNAAPWIRAKTVAASDLQASDLDDKDVVVLLDVADLPEDRLRELTNFVGQGGGLIIAPGPSAAPNFYNGAFWNAGQGLLPARLESPPAEELAAGPVVLDADSFDAPWMARFRAGVGVDLAGTRISRWWKLLPMEESEKPADPGDAQPVPPATAKHSAVGEAVVAGRLKTGAPWIVTRRFGAGQTGVIATPLDAEWSTLPSRTDFVPFLHEFVFSLLSRDSGRNVDAGMPLELPLPEHVPLASVAFRTPDGRELAAQRGGNERRPTARLDAALIPGVYQAIRKSRPQDPPEYFAVEFDRREADLTPLDEASLAQLTGAERMSSIRGVDEWSAAVAGDAPRSEIWWLLLLAVLGLLVFEVVMTRRLIKGGHELTESEDAAGEAFGQSSDAAPGTPGRRSPRGVAVGGGNAHTPTDG